jgi:AcrR family transcriptional regulator
MRTTAKPGRPVADPARDLRRALLITSRTLLDTDGPSALSMREVARRTGCTHQAPYHYFEDRESILATLVAEGFDDLAVRLQAANAIAAVEGPRAALLASGHAYVGFALEHPGVFRIMFRPDLCDASRFPAVQDAGTRAREELDVLNRILHTRDADAASATMLWSHVHGLAGLLIDGPLSAPLAMPAEQQAHVTEVLARFADLMLGATPYR